MVCYSNRCCGKQECKVLQKKGGITSETLSSFKHWQQKGKIFKQFGRVSKKKHRSEEQNGTPKFCPLINGHTVSWLAAQAKARQLLDENENMLSLWHPDNKLLQLGERLRPPFSPCTRLGDTLMKTKGSIFIVTMQRVKHLTFKYGVLVLSGKVLDNINKNYCCLRKGTQLKTISDACRTAVQGSVLPDL